MKTIYTAGKMSGVTYGNAMSWRRMVEELIKSSTDKSIRFIHPPIYYNYEHQNHKTEKEVKDWELNAIRHSDIIIVNLDNINDSVGSHYELATADLASAYTGDKKFIIGVGGLAELIHPWILESIHRREDDFKSAAEYIVNYLLD